MWTWASSSAWPPRCGSTRHGAASPALAYRIEVAHDIAACAKTVAIQREIWSGDVVVPPQLLLATVHNGGFVAVGYVDGDDQAAGFVYGFLGIYDHHVRHHSHMLAVRAPHRGSGLAMALKEAQRDHCLDQGIEVMGWTMDPLEALNARFNFAKLGAYAREYHRDFYGDMPDKLNVGIVSDRLYVEWPIGNDRSYRRLRGDDTAASLDQAERKEVRYLLRGEDGRPGAVAGPSGETHLLLEIPTNVQELKVRDRPLAVEWRFAVRAAFEAAFTAGYAAVEFLRSGERGAYFLVPQPPPSTDPSTHAGSDAGGPLPG